MPCSKSSSPSSRSFRSPHASPSSLSHQPCHPHPRNHRQVPCSSDSKPFPSNPDVPLPVPPHPSPKMPPWSPRPRQAMPSQTPITFPAKLLPILNLPFPSCLPTILPQSQTLSPLPSPLPPLGSVAALLLLLPSLTLIPWLPYLPSLITPPPQSFLLPTSHLSQHLILSVS